MNQTREILGNCFHSNSPVWREFLRSTGKLATLYYPSAADDFRPFVFSIKKSLDFIGIKFLEENYIEPDLFIFSDYFPYPNSYLFETKILHSDNYTGIYLEESCDLIPNDAFFNYSFNENNVECSTSHFTGKAKFFRARIHSHITKEVIYKYGLYFFYDNINLIDQLFLKNNLVFSHLVWKRDGSDLGLGRFRHDFLFPISEKLSIQYYFVWDNYMDEENPKISNDVLSKHLPNEFIPHIDSNFSLYLEKLGKLRWDKYDQMNFYIKKKPSFQNTNKTISQVLELDTI